MCVLRMLPRMANIVQRFVHTCIYLNQKILSLVSGYLHIIQIATYYSSSLIPRMLTVKEKIQEWSGNETIMAAVVCATTAT